MPTEKPVPTVPSGRARDACTDDIVPINVRVGHPRVRPHVVPIAGRTTPYKADDFVTSFLVVWQPSPPPPPLWVRFLREAPFGTQLVRAQDLHWDGKYLSIELLHEADIEAYAAEMSQWVDYANSELAHCEKSPAALALKAAQKRAEDLENRLRR
ncbi:MAG TPA: hypothetical protein VMH79_02730 [Thermoanaerobaculia bacterium]|nr:hypothetical protein [Thermoanaerobaculia bacterium]